MKDKFHPETTIYTYSLFKQRGIKRAIHEHAAKLNIEGTPAYIELVSGEAKRTAVQRRIVMLEEEAPVVPAAEREDCSQPAAIERAVVFAFPHGVSK